jgi:hypothetical protein
VDADGVGDLAFVQWGQVEVAYGRNERWSSDVTLEPDLSLTFENAGGPTTALAIGDIDADGAPDTSWAMPRTVRRRAGPRPGSGRST